MAGKPKYDGPKRDLKLTVTETAVNRMEEMVQLFGLRSKSELVEQFARGILPAGQTEQDVQRLGESSAT